MSDCIRRYRAIREALKNTYPEEPRGNHARHLNTLAGLISGIVGAQHSHLPKLAREVPDGAKPASRVKRYERWLRNEAITWELYFLPFVEVLLNSLAAQTLVLVLDGSGVGRGCVTLMLSVVYRGRALPVAWLVVAGKKGHFPEDCHIELVNRVRDLLPTGADVVLVGDGEFDGTALQTTLAEAHWHYVCRTAKNTLLYEAGEAFHFADVPLCPGERLGIPEGDVRGVERQIADGTVRIVPAGNVDVADNGDLEVVLVEWGGLGRVRVSEEDTRDEQHRGQVGQVGS